MEIRNYIQICLQDLFNFFLRQESQGKQKYKTNKILGYHLSLCLIIEEKHGKIPLTIANNFIFSIDIDERRV